MSTFDAAFSRENSSLRPADRCQLVLAAIAHRDLVARHEEHLSDRQVERAGDPFALLQDVAELGFVRVPVGSTRTTSIGATGRSIMLKIGV